MRVRIRTWLVVFAGVSALTAAPAMAEPDFARAFERLDANGDGVLSFGELRYEGVEAVRYAYPESAYVTDDGYGVELWRTPFGIATASMSDEMLATKMDMRAKTYLRDERVRLMPPLMLAANPELRTMTPGRFEKELRTHVERSLDGLDQDKNGGVSPAEIDRAMLARDASHLRFPDFQRGAGGDAMRAHSRELLVEYYASLDGDNDGQFTADEMLEDILDRLVDAFALPR